MHKFEIKKVLDFSVEQLYNIIIDIDSYQEFVPWCGGSRVLERYNSYLIADLVIKFKLYTEKYRSKVAFEAPNGGFALVEAEMIEGPFKYLTNNWRLSKKNSQQTLVSFFVDFEFKSSVLDKVVGLVFESTSKRMIEAFEQRAHAIYRDKLDN